MAGAVEGPVGNPKPSRESYLISGFFLVTCRAVDVQNQLGWMNPYEYPFNLPTGAALVE